MVRQFKLTVHLHATGQYRKRIAGRDYYLGTDHDEAIKMLQAIVEKKNGDTGAYADGSIRLNSLAAMFEAYQKGEVKAGRMQRGTASDNNRAVIEFLVHTGESREVRDLKPEDFANVRQIWENRVGVFALNRNILAVRRLFNWAVESVVIKTPPAYGKQFKLAGRSVVRAHRAVVKEERGDRKFTDDELRAIINHEECTGVLRTCIMLALNCGMYAVDCGELKWKDIRKVEGVTCIDRQRFKTNVKQRAPLWPPIVERLEAIRPPSAKPDDIVFRQPNGSPVFVRASDHDWLSKQFSHVYGLACTKRQGIGFGALKHTHTSAVGDHHDRVARFAVRAHLLADEDVEGTYDIPSVSRLQAVTMLAYERLWLRYQTAPAESVTPPPKVSSRTRRSSRQA